MELRVGSLIGDEFLVERTLGAEHGLTVITARQLRVDRRVAIRVLPGGTAESAALARFARARQIESAHVPKFIAFGTLDDGRPYFVTEQFEGSSLTELIGQRPLPPADAADLALQACDAVAAAHAAGAVHKRLTMECLFLANDGGSRYLKVLNFGPADDSAPDEAGAIYRAPEQLSGESRVDHRCDIWSLGAIFYQLLTGKVPFSGPGSRSVLKQILHAPPRSPRNLRPEIPEPLAQAVLRCLERSPDARWPRVADLSQALSQSGSRRGYELAARTVRLAGPAAAPRRPPAPAGPAAAGIVGSFDPPPSSEDEIGFRTISERGIEPLNSVSVARLSRAKRVAHEASALSRDGPAQRSILLAAASADEEEEGAIRSLGGGAIEEEARGPRPYVIVVAIVAAILFGLLIAGLFRIVTGQP
jgi:serine/threonine protein kinase